MSSSLDPYTDPATVVLRNRLGITDPDELGRAEGIRGHLNIERAATDSERHPQ